MSAIPCPSCGERMNEASIVCPHCGKRRPDGEVGLAKKSLSKDEVKALLTVDAKPAAAQPGGLMTALIFPHPTTHGTARAVETICTLIALPLVIVGAFTLGFPGRRRRRIADPGPQGELVPVLAMSTLGGLGLYSALTFAGLASGTALVILGVSVAALVIRGTVRSHATNATSRDLDRLAKPEKPRR
jgi:hypothetical protein